MPTTRAELTERIDRLGELRARIHVLTSEADAVGEDVRIALEKRASKAASGKLFRAELVPGSTTEIADIKGLAKAAGRRLLEIVTIRLAEARRVLGNEAVDAFCRKVPTSKLTIKPLADKEAVA